MASPDDMERVMESGKSVLSSVDTKTKGGNTPSTWEGTVEDGFTNPYTMTVVSLKDRNTRGGGSTAM